MRVTSRLKREFVARCLSNPEKFTEMLHADMLRVLNVTYGVLCFSTLKDSLLMWAHYARSHEGLVVEFNSEDNEFRRLGELREVAYPASRPILDPTKPPTFEPFLRKSPEWKYEREYRIMRRLDSCKRRSVNGIDLFFVHMPRRCVRAVYLGNRMDPAIAKQISNLMAGTPAELYQAELHSREFGLIFKRIR